MGVRANIAIAAALAAVLACGCAPAAPTLRTDGSGSGSVYVPATRPEPEIEIEPEPVIDLAEATVTVEDQTYTGIELTPAVTVTLDGKTLTEGADYTLEFEDNVDPGKGTVTVTAAGDYEGTATATFTIEPHQEGWDKLAGYNIYYTADSAIATDSFVPGTDGTWYYVGKYGAPVTNRWISFGGNYYFIGSDGHAVFNDWVSVRGAAYYCGADGSPVTGLQTIDGDAYIFNANGTLRYISNSERLDRIVCRLIRDTTGFDTRVAYDYVAQSFTYKRQPIDTSFAGWEEQYALDLVDTGIGNCYNYSALYGFLLRAMGYDCRIVDGICSNRNDGKFYHHSWVEVYMDAGTYVCDPVLERFNGSNIPSYFITYAENKAATTWALYELDWDGYPALSPQYP